MMRQDQIAAAIERDLLRADDGKPSDDAIQCFHPVNAVLDKYVSRVLGTEGETVLSAQVRLEKQ